MHVPPWVWALTLLGFASIIGLDLLRGRGGRIITTAAAARGIAVYVSLAALFGVGLLVLGGSEPAGQFAAGYVLEYSLSVDNLFVYLLLMTSFAVPEELRARVLLVGIVGTLLLRFPFIFLGAEAAQRFSATFYVFGALLIWTAIQLVRGKEEEEVKDASEHIAVRLASKVMRTTGTYDGTRLTTRVEGQRAATPLLLVMLAVSVTGLVFALDSIPAIFGVTKDTYVIVAANAFALMGLRQLYFLVGGLLERLVHLDKGLAVILGFIGVKLVLEALHEQGVHAVPVIGVGLSLEVIVGVLVLTVVASLLAQRRAAAAPSPR